MLDSVHGCYKNMNEHNPLCNATLHEMLWWPDSVSMSLFMSLSYHLHNSSGEVPKEVMTSWLIIIRQGVWSQLVEMVNKNGTDKTAYVLVPL